MIERYWGEKMAALWKTSQSKFARWLDVEIAVLRAREALKQIPEGTAQEAKENTWMDCHTVNSIERRDREIKHDLNAFIEIMRVQIIVGREEFKKIAHLHDDAEFNQRVREGLAMQGDAPSAGFFHDGMTSYDTEEPAIALLLRDSCEIITEGMEALAEALKKRALQHRGMPMVGRTHGQHAQPITFGKKLLDYCDMVVRSNMHLHCFAADIQVMKLSGAVGMYGTLDPKVEEAVGRELKLTPVIATQIIALDRRARLVNEMALTASILAKISYDFWLMSQTEVGEIQEPFGKSQKGSSAMPHKKNPITLEQIMGLPRLMRGYASAMMENVVTAHERDISHSSVERIGMVDAFSVLDHLLRITTRTIEGMEVFPEKMLANLDLTYGTIGSQGVEMWLKQSGMPAEAAYRKVQSACGTAMKDKIHLRELLLSDPEVMALTPDKEQLAACFDWKEWVREEDHIYAQAFPPE